MEGERAESWLVNEDPVELKQIHLANVKFLFSVRPLYDDMLSYFPHLSYSLSYTLSLLPPSFCLFEFPPLLATGVEDLDSSSIKMEFLLLSFLIGVVVEILWTEVESLLWVEVGVELVEESAALRNSQDEESTWMAIIIMAIIAITIIGHSNHWASHDNKDIQALPADLQASLHQPAC